MKNNNRLPIPQIIIMVITMISMSFLVIHNAISDGYNYIDYVVAVVIVVELIGVAASLLLLKKRDPIEKSEERSMVELNTRIDIIDKNVKKIEDTVIEKIIPSLDLVLKSEQQSSKDIRILVDELNFQNRLKGETPINLKNEDYFKHRALKLNEENAKLNAQIEAFSLLYEKLSQLNIPLISLNESLSSENEELKSQIKTLSPENMSQ